VIAGGDGLTTPDGAPVVITLLLAGGMPLGDILGLAGVWLVGVLLAGVLLVGTVFVGAVLVGAVLVGVIGLVGGGVDAVRTSELS
jgi:hypothetical protein